ncbi:MAG: YiiX/YebB-like N1pC/P60 family cysteine hydrolase [Rikenellaceae bacterium]
MVLGDLKIVGLILFLLLISSSISSCQSSEDESIKRNITIKLHDGDIAFRRGLGVVSNAVVMMNNRATYSHCGIVVHHNGEWCVVHAVPYEGERLEDDKVYCEPIGEFYSSLKAHCGAIYHLERLDSVERQRVVSYARYHLDAKTLFDHDYNLEDDERLYCSELVWRAYLAVDCDLSQGRRTHVVLPPFKGVHIMPADIELNDSLSLIYSF